MRARLELGYALGETPPFLRDCPQVCGKTKKRMEDPEKGCGNCPVVRVLSGHDAECRENMLMLCGEKDGEPNSEYTIEELQMQASITGRIDRELDGKGYNRDAEMIEIECLDVYRDEKDGLDRKLIWEAKNKK